MISKCSRPKCSWVISVMVHKDWLHIPITTFSNIYYVHKFVCWNFLLLFPTMWTMDPSQKRKINKKRVDLAFVLKLTTHRTVTFQCFLVFACIIQLVTFSKISCKWALRPIFSLFIVKHVKTNALMDKKRFKIERKPSKTLAL